MSNPNGATRWKTIAAVIAAAPFAAVLAWYAVSFLPHLGELDAFVEQGEKIRESANPAFYRMAVTAEKRERIRSYAVREAYWSLVGERGPTIDRQLNEALWLLASHIHFDDDEVFALWIECSLYGCGSGLMDASVKYFQKPIASLTEDELAGLVALVRSPGMFAPGTPRGEERKKMILEARHAHS